MNKMVPDHIHHATSPHASPADTLGSSPAVLFQGYDSITSSARSTAVKGSQTNGGAIARSYYTVCRDIETLMSALNISASVSASFGFGSVSAKSDFMSSLSVTTTSITVVVYTNVVTDSAAFTDVAFAGPPPADMDMFFRENGDSWVSELVRGAEYMAVYVFYSQSAEQQQGVIKTLAANGITAGGSISAPLQTALQHACSQVNTQQSLKQFMSGHTKKKLPPADKIIQFALDFSALTPDAPVVNSFEVTGYEHVAGMPDHFYPVVLTRNLVKGTSKRQGLATQFARLSAVVDSVDHIQGLYDLYGYRGDTVMPAKLAQIEADLATLTTLFERMDRTPTATYATPALRSLAYGAPALNTVVNTKRLGGGTGGVPFQDVSAQDVLSGTRIGVVSFHGTGWVDQIAITYLNGQSADTQIHGGDGGDQGPCLILGRHERIVSVTGTAGRFINQITLKTNQGNSINWPPTPDEASPFTSWTASDATVLIGFCGQAGRRLDELGVVTATFSPAHWSG